MLFQVLVFDYFQKIVDPFLHVISRTRILAFENCQIKESPVQ